MMKLFRGIRHRLLKENRLTKYLAYAAGEIILVVIGILIALQINNWNEDRKLRALEVVYYCKILEDFEMDKVRVERSYQQAKERLEHGRQVLLSMHRKDKSKSEILNLFLLALRLDVYVPRRTTFDDLENSGNLKILADDDLKNDPIQYYGETENIVLQMNQNRDELVQRSFVKDVTEMGFQEFDYLKSALGAEILELLPNVDWISNKNSPYFRDFQNNVVFIITMLDRHQQHLRRISALGEGIQDRLEKKCI